MRRRPGGDGSTSAVAEDPELPPACCQVHRSSSPQPNSGERSAVTRASSSLGSATARAAASRSRTSRLGRPASSTRRGSRCRPRRARPPVRQRGAGRHQDRDVAAARCRRHAAGGTATCQRFGEGGLRPRRRRRPPPARAASPAFGRSACASPPRTRTAVTGRARRRGRRDSGRYGGCESGDGDDQLAEDGVDPVEDRRDGAEVGGQHDRLAERLLGVEVGGDVGAAEPVDRLLRVADHEQRCRPAPRRRPSASWIAAAPPAMRTASSIWIGSVSWNSSSSSRRYRCCSRRAPSPPCRGERSRSRASTSRSWNSRRPSARRTCGVGQDRGGDAVRQPAQGDVDDLAAQRRPLPRPPPGIRRAALHVVELPVRLAAAVPVRGRRPRRSTASRAASSGAPCS